MLENEKKFVMKKENYIVCPNCKNDKKFRLIADKIEPGIFEIKIGCCGCDWVSDDIYEDCGFSPDMGKEMIAVCVKDLHDRQTG